MVFSVNIQRITKTKILFSAQHIFIYDMVTRKFDIVATMGEEYERHSPLIIATKGAKTYLSDLKNICEYDSSEGTFGRFIKDNTLLMTPLWIRMVFLAGFYRRFGTL